MTNLVFTWARKSVKKSLLAVLFVVGVAFFSSSTAQAATAFVKSTTNDAYGTSVTASFTGNVAAGNTIAVFVGWYPKTPTLTSVTDTCGTSYTIVSPTVGAGGAAAMAYGVVPTAGACRVTALTSSGTTFIEVIAHEVSGVDTTNPLDQARINAQAAPGTAANAVSSGSITTSQSGDYIFATAYNDSLDTVTLAAGTGFTARQQDLSSVMRSEDTIQASAGPITATFTTNSAFARFLTGIMALKASDGTPPPLDTVAPSVPTNLSGTGTSQTSISLSWTASTDNVAVTGYNIYRNGTQIGTSASTGYSDTGLIASTTFLYAVAAYDAAGNISAQTPVVNVSTQAAPVTDTTAPSVPTGLTGTSTSQTSATLSWTASTDNVSVTGYRVYRGGTQIATTANTTYTNTGLTAGTNYSYTVASYDAAGNISAQSGAVSVTTLPTTPTGDATPPVVTMTLPVNGRIIAGTATTVSATASDNVAVVGVQFLLDGANIGTEDTTSPYSISWNSTTASNGAHTISARARDAAGNTTIANAVNITVDNQAPIGSILINAGASAINTRNVTLTLSASDAQTSVTQMRFSNTTSGFSTAEAYATTKAWTLSSGAGTKTVYVQFKDAAGNWSAASAISDTIAYETTAPTISAVSSSNITNSGATINWTTNEPATSQVEYGLTTSYGTLSSVDPALVTAHSFVLSGLSSQTTYNYRVRSIDAAGNQRIGSNLTFTTLSGPDVTAPSAPTNLAANVVSSSRINLSWTASTDNVAVTGYKIFQNGVQIAFATTTSYTDVNLSPSTTYSYTVSAYDAAGNNSMLANPINATTQAPPDTTPPSTPEDLVADAVSPTTINLTWTESSDNVGVTGYKIFRDGLQVATSTVNSFSNTGLVFNTLYTYTVRAFDAMGNTSGNSLPASVVTPAPNTPPPVISNVSATSTQSGVVITWTTDVPADSQVEYGLTSAYGTFSAINPELENVHSVTLQNLSSATTYYFRVKSKDFVGNPAVSEGSTFTTIDVPTITLVGNSQSVGCTSAASSTCTVTLTKPIAPGNFLVITGWANNAVYIKDINAGGKYVDGLVRNGAPFGATRGFLSGGYATTTAATNGPIVVTFSGATGGAQVNIREYAVSGGNLQFDASNDTLVKPVANPFASPALTLSGKNDLIVSWAGANTSIASVAAPYENASISNDQTGSGTADRLNTLSGNPAFWTAAGSATTAATASMAFGFNTVPCQSVVMLNATSSAQGRVINATDLNGSTVGTYGNGTGSENWKWTTTNSKSAMRWSTAANKPSTNSEPVRFCAGGNTFVDNGMGIQYDTTAGALQYIHMHFPGQNFIGYGVSKSSSTGVWFNTSLPNNATINADILTLYGLNGGFINLILWGNTQNLIVRCETAGSPPCEASIPIQPNTWYWFTLQYNPGGIHKGAVYDQNMNLVGSFQSADKGGDTLPGSVFFGQSISGALTPNAVMNFDDFKVCYIGDCPFPMRP